MDKEKELEFERVLVELLIQKGLKSISIKVHGEIDFVLNALRKMDLRNRGNMRARCCIAMVSNKALDYLNVFESKLKMNDNDYLLKFECILTEDILNKIDECRFGFGCNVGEIFRLTRTSVNCKLNGYGERWIYPCVCNKC